MHPKVFCFFFINLILRTGTGNLSWNRLEAAKEVFVAFATRTGAIRLHHSFGLTVFGSIVDVKFSLSKKAEKFCVGSVITLKEYN